MPTAMEDPYYSRKRVPDAFVGDVGDTGLSPEEAYQNRERKYSSASKSGKDVRKFWNPSGKSNKGNDPYYQRKPVPNPLTQGVGVTGLTPEEEFATRERKYSLPDGSDARKFSSAKGGLEPQNDPYYSRKQAPKAAIVGVAETGNTAAEDYGVRERKQSLFQLSDDPFAQVTGHHRQSVSSPGYTAAAVDAHRRKSSAIAPDAARAVAARVGGSNGGNGGGQQHHQHSGYDGPQLAPIESRPEFAAGSDLAGSSTNGTRNQGHDDEIEYEDPDAVAPHEKR